MRLIIYMIKRLLLSKTIWGWGFAFVIFWAAMGAFLLSSDVPKLQDVDYMYTASWAGTVIIFSLGAIGTSITYVVTYQSGGLPHMLRFSKLTPQYYLLSIYLGALVVISVIGLITLSIVGAMFSAHFGIPLYPRNMFAETGEILLAALLMTSLSLLLNVAIVKISRKAQNLISFVPLLLSFLFGYGYIYLNLGNLTYLSPYTAIDSLLIQGYVNHPIPLDLSAFVISHLNNGQLNYLGSLNPIYAVLSAMMWFLLFTAISIPLVRSLYYRPLEESRIA
jgi:hypothetical protein